MAYSAAALDAGIAAATADDRPCMIMKNHLEDPAIATEWHEDDIATGAQSDVTNPDYPTSNLANGQPWTVSKVELGLGKSTYYLYIRLATRTVDAIAIKLGRITNGNADITVKVSDAANFTGGTTKTVATWSGVQQYRRVASLNLGYNGITPPVQYTSLQYVQIAFTNTVGSFPIEVSEVWLGERRQLASRLELEYDDQPIGLDTAAFRSRGRATTRYVLAKGYRDLGGTLLASNRGSNVYSGLNDLDTMRDGFAENKFGTLPVAYWELPASAPNSFLMGYIMTDLHAPQGNACRHPISFDFEEQPPFLVPEEG
jgi:hypothetical protein